MKIDKVKVGLVGLGLVSDSHIKAFQSHPNAEMVAICDLDEAHAKEVAAQYGIGKYYTSYEDMLNDEDINLIDICTPTFTHVSMVIKAANAKKHILCEKPFCMNLAEGELACEVAKKNNVSLTVEESYRFMSSLMKARELIEAGEIGKPTQIRQRFGEWINKEGVLDNRKTTELHRGWRTNTQKAGGNGFPWMFDHCVHFFTAAEFLMMDTPIKEVNAVMTDNSWSRKNKNDEITLALHGNDVGDISLLTWSYEDPACNGVWMRAEMINGQYDHMTGFSITVVGEKGMIEVLGEGASGLQLNGEPTHLILHRKDGTKQTFRFDEGGDDIWQSDISYYSQAHTNLIHRLVDSIINQTAVPYSGEDGVRDVKTTLAAICSAREGRPIKISEVTDELYLGKKQKSVEQKDAITFSDLV